jgi:Family of unknown function (DUF6114)
MISNAGPAAHAVTAQSRRVGGAWDKFTAPTERYRRPFRTWRRGRPFIPGLCILLAGLEIYWAPHSTVGKLLSMGLPGISSLFIPIFLVVFAITVWFFPTYRVFSGIAAILLALLSLVATNLGGFFIGFLLAMLGGAFAVAWTPRPGYTADTRRQRRRHERVEARQEQFTAGESTEVIGAASPEAETEREAEGGNEVEAQAETEHEPEAAQAEAEAVSPEYVQNTQIIEKAARSDEAGPAAETTTEEE